MKTVGVAHLKVTSQPLPGSGEARAGGGPDGTRRAGGEDPLQGAERAESRRERLARAGVLQLGTGRVRASLLKPPKGSVEVGAGVLKALLEEREKGR